MEKIWSSTCKEERKYGRPSSRKSVILLTLISSLYLSTIPPDSEPTPPPSSNPTNPDLTPLNDDYRYGGDTLSSGRWECEIDTSRIQVCWSKKISYSHIQTVTVVPVTSPDVIDLDESGTKNSNKVVKRTYFDHRWKQSPDRGNTFPRVPLPSVMGIPNFS